MVWRLSLLVLALALAAPGTARAGPVFEGPDFVLFPLTLRLWAYHALAPDPVVKVSQRGAQPLDWSVEYLTLGGRPLREAHGTLALPAAPEGCEPLVLAALLPPNESPAFGPVNRMASQSRVLTDADDIKALVTWFDRDFEPEVQIVSEPGRCERIRERCVADERADFYSLNPRCSGISASRTIPSRAPGSTRRWRRATTPKRARSRSRSANDSVAGSCSPRAPRAVRSICRSSAPIAANGVARPSIHPDRRGSSRSCS
jgi:hypothetical protein